MKQFIYKLKNIMSKTYIGLSVFALTPVSAFAAGSGAKNPPAGSSSGPTLSSLSTNINHVFGDTLHIVSIAGVGLAVIFGFLAFNHLRSHSYDQGGQQKHMGKFFMHTIIAVGFLSVPAILHMLENSAFSGISSANTAWSVSSTEAKSISTDGSKS